MTGCNKFQVVVSMRMMCTVVSMILLAGALAGCGGSNREMMVRSDFVPFTQEQKSDIEARGTHSYRIQERDKLKVYFAYERELNQDGVVVLNDGTVSLIGVGNIRLAGLTLSEADSVVTSAYSREYREPSLSVMVQETFGRRVYVLGEVQNPGLHQVPMGGIDIMGAIAVAGGFTEAAARDGSLVIRVTPEGYQFQELNLKGYGAAEFAQVASVPLLNYDVVYIPRSRIADFGYFSRNVLSGFAYITRMVYDIQFISTGKLSRF